MEKFKHVPASKQRYIKRYLSK